MNLIVVYDFTFIFYYKILLFQIPVLYDFLVFLRCLWKKRKKNRANNESNKY